MLLHADNFATYATADVSLNYTLNGGGTRTIQNTGGRFNSGFLRTSSSSGGSSAAYCSVGFSAVPTIILGFAVRLVSFSTGSGCELVRINRAGSMIFSIRVDNSLKLYAINGSGAVLSNGSGSRDLKLNVWHYFEVKITPKSAMTVGDCVVRMDEQIVMQPTGDVGNGNVDGVTIGSTPGLYTFYVDYGDLYLANTTGGGVVDFLGDVRVVSVLPNANGSYQNFGVSGAGSHFTLVDDATPSFSDFVSSKTPGHKETFLFTPISVTSLKDVIAMRHGVSAVKDSSGSRSVRMLAKRGATEVADSSVLLAGSPIFTPGSFMEIDPVTSAAWTLANINATEGGIEVIA